MALCTVVNCNRDEFDVYIGRPSIYGNPFMIGKHGTRAEVISMYGEWVEGSRLGPNGEKPPTKTKIKAELTGKRIACHCAPKSCHGDYLAALVNSKHKGLFE